MMYSRFIVGSVEFERFIAPGNWTMGVEFHLRQVVKHIYLRVGPLTVGATW